MKNIFRFLTIAGLLVFGVRAADDVTAAVRGAATKADAATKTAVEKAKDGTEHSIHWTEKTAVKGADLTATEAKHVYSNAKEGSEAVVHGTVTGTEKTCEEVKKLGKDGMTSTEGAVAKVGEGGKTIAEKSAEGTEHTFEAVEHGSRAGATGIGKSAEKTGKATAKFVEDGSKKVAHVFERP
jgi:hypothetical protein